MKDLHPEQGTGDRRMRWLAVGAVILLAGCVALVLGDVTDDAALSVGGLLAVLSVLALRTMYLWRGALPALLGQVGLILLVIAVAAALQRLS